ncbi:prohead protease/major capsid protein fusion protein [Chromobacterium haemolyticum]|uniref:prohead protease/major capsid protein fusion protein n=1 Tax=Chromobacterium haemolyticum TaxID=394935 RepID=UPI00244AF408|nr:prohead protease/major capsid protein fusion protein [Chromobacterium haemolyticum]MDH0340626.1 Mu-like prophage major head subunit gpT family protein [Chromobacterium haemolyticum]
MPDKTPDGAAPPELVIRNGLPLVSVRAQVGTIDEEARTVELVWSTGAVVRRFDWNRWRPFDEELSMEPTAVRMDRLNNGAPLLDTHFQLSLAGQLGVVEWATLEKGKGRSLVRFSRREQVEPIWRDVVEGIIRNVSVGYLVHAYQITEDPDGGVARYLAVDWEPYEISLVPVPADADAGIRGAKPESAPSYPVRYIEAAPAAAVVEPQQQTRNLNEDNAMPQNNEPQNVPPAQPDATEIRALGAKEENDRQGQIRKLESAYNFLGADFFRSMYNDPKCDINQARALVLDKMAEDSEQNKTRSHANVQTLRDETETRRSAMAEAIHMRAFPNVERSDEARDMARQFRGMNLSDMARECVEQAGGNVRGLSRPELVDLALNNNRSGGMQTTSDFTVILANVANRSMMQGYTLAGQTFWPLVRRTSAPDFKEQSRLQVGHAVALKEVNEAGEFEIGQLNDATAERYKLRTFGRIINISRHVIINDDLSVFNDLSAGFGRSAANLESNLVWGLILSSAARLSDGKPLFDDAHGNQGAAAELSIDTIDELDQLIGQQTEPGSGEDLSLSGKYLLVPRTLKLKAQRSIGFVSATKVDDLNPIAGEYQIITDPRIARASKTGWYLAADPINAPTIEIAYLEGQEGIYTSSQEGFEVDGVQVKARLDVGVGLMDHRWIARNPGKGAK